MTDPYIEADLRQFLGVKLGRDLSALPSNMSLTDSLGLDSLAQLELMAEIEVRFDVYFSEEQLNQMQSIRSISEALEHMAAREMS